MKTYQILSALLPIIKDFEETIPNNEDFSISTFSSFLSSYSSTNSVKNVEINDINIPPHPERTDAIIAQNINFVYRYMKRYFKKALNNSPLISLDEYTYLICLLRVEKMTKTELNNINIMEKTSGTEVINRLLKNKLIDQAENPADRRSLFVFITEKGKKMLYELMPELVLAVEILLNPLSLDQKNLLKGLLLSLDKHNRNLFLNEHDTSLLELNKQIN